MVEAGKKYTKKELQKMDHDKLVEIILEIQKHFYGLADKVEKFLKPDKDSQNSSKPPSQDQGRKERKYVNREKSNKKPGGQRGHKGKERDWEEKPDEVVTLSVERCSCCGEDLSNSGKREKERRQQIEIPPIKIQTTEYIQEENTCMKCGTVNRGEFPEGVYGRISLGKNIQARASMIFHAYYGSYKRTVEYLEDFYNLHISEGTLANILKRVNDKLKPEEDKIIEELKKSKCIGSDETGTFIEGKKGWNFIFQNKRAVLIKAATSRAFDMIEKTIGLIYRGGWLSDRFAAQLKIISGWKQICLAHILRELEYLEQSYKDQYSKEFKDLIYEIIGQWKEWWEKGKEVSQKEKDNIIGLLNRKLENFLARVRDGTDVPEEITKYFKGINKVRNYILPCLSEGIPFHNNDSERPLRHVKNALKISGGFRTNSGAQQYARFISFYHTSKRKNLNPFQALCAVL